MLSSPRDQFALLLARSKAGESIFTPDILLEDLEAFLKEYDELKQSSTQMVIDRAVHEKLRIDHDHLKAVMEVASKEEFNWRQQARELREIIKRYNFCKEHEKGASSGTYAGCLHCGLKKAEEALDQIDMLNVDADAARMGYSHHCIDYDADGVVVRTKKLISDFMTNLRKAVDLAGRAVSQRGYLPEGSYPILEEVRTFLGERKAAEEALANPLKEGEHG